MLVATVLIIEDDKAMRDLLRGKLGDEYQIVETGHAQEALALALQHRPDCILLDLMLAEFSGFELCQTFSSLSQTRLIPILVITGKPATEYREFCLNLGAADYFEKPIDFVRLKIVVDAVVERKPAERRKEVRIPVHVILKLAGKDMMGSKFEVLTVTENVGPTGFLASCGAPLKEGSVVEVFLGSKAGRYAGPARVVRVDWQGSPWQSYGFQFTQKPEQWILD